MTDFNGIGIALRGGVNVEINDCAISGIQTNYSGVGTYTDFPTSGTVQINNCIISNFGSGGISVAGALDLEVNSCHIEGNINDLGGGIAWGGSANNTMLVSRCNLIGNTASDMGGGIYSSGSMARIEDCNITGNTAGSKGGGVYSGDHLVLKRCRIENNTAVDGGGGIGGSGYIDANHCIIRENEAVEYGGGIFAYDVNLINCIINENRTGGYGGGIRALYDSYLYNCTIRNNEANGLGGGAYFGDGPINVTNCIFWGNADTEDTPGYQRRHQIFSLSAIYVYFRNCDIQNTTASGLYVYDDNIIYNLENPEPNIIGKNLGGNINNDPDFADDYHLKIGSPCINAGDNSVVYWAYDIDGDNRILDAIVDIGADEEYYYYYFCPNPADYNKDGIVNFLDFAIFANAWQTQNPNISLDGDNDVDIYDLRIFCGSWLSYCN
jgi:predicted outer membrane repeat protein